MSSSPPSQTAVSARAKSAFGTAVGVVNKVGGFIGNVMGILSFGSGALLLIGTHTQILSSVEAFWPQPSAQPTSPAQSVVIVSSDDLMANSYQGLLKDGLAGVDVHWLDFSQTDALPVYHPGLVIIGSTRPQTDNITLSEPTKRLLSSGNVKVLGVGVQGAFVLNQIAPGSPLSSRNSVGISRSEVVLGHRLSDTLRAHLPLGGSLHLYTHDGDASGVAVYDSGSLENQGAEGIAEISDSAADECSAHYWAVASQGNNAIWGFAENANDLTQEGTQLFVNTVQEMLSTKLVTQQTQQEQYYRPDTYYNRSVGCRYPSNTYRIKAAGAQTMHIGVNSKSSSLQVTILGPLESNKLIKPASADTQVVVSPQSAAAGTDWTVTVTYTGHMTMDTTAYYDLTLDYMSSGPASVHTAIVIIALSAFGGLLIVGGVVVFFMRRAWRRLRLF